MKEQKDRAVCLTKGMAQPDSELHALCNDFPFDKPNLPVLATDADLALEMTDS